MTREPLTLDQALAVLETNAAVADGTAAWPACSWDALRRAGVLGWIIPQRDGGQELDSVALLEGYSRVAGACLTTCFLLSQRDAACRRLRDGGNHALCRELLPSLARGERFATVGLSQLTTSRQHVRPVLVATDAGDSIVLNGVMPWVTGADHADHFVTGAVLEDGQQLLLVVPRATAGVRIGPPLELMALQGSLTAEVRCDEARLAKEWILAGPTEKVMPPGRGAGSLETSALALGLASAAIRQLGEEADKRPEWRTRAETFVASEQALRDWLHGLARTGGTPEEGARIRAHTNALVLRATQLALAASKGSGFLRSHVAQRHARQALFFLVWSCPRPALEATMDYLEPPDIK